MINFSMGGMETEKDQQILRIRAQFNGLINIKNERPTFFVATNDLI